MRNLTVLVLSAVNLIFVFGCGDYSNETGTDSATDSDSDTDIDSDSDTDTDSDSDTDTDLDWTLTTVDSNGDVGDANSLAIDSFGNVHISYIERATSSLRNLKYATNVGGDWVIDDIDSSIGLRTSIALDHNDNAHIAYSSSGTLKYATNQSGSWEISTADASLTIAVFYPSIAVDSSGNVHIIYYSEPPLALQYSTNASGSWVVSTIDESGGLYNSVTLDSNNDIYVAYTEKIDADNTNLKFAIYSKGAWTQNTFDDEGDVGTSHPSLATDQNDDIHLCYYKGGGLIYSFTSAGIPTLTDVVTQTGSACSIAFDQNDQSGFPHVSYSSSVEESLVYACFENSWEPETVDTIGTLSPDNSFSIDQYGNIHISYYDRVNLNLKHATRTL